MSLHPFHSLSSASVMGANSRSWISSRDGTDAAAPSSTEVTAVAAADLAAAARRGRVERGAGDGETGDGGASIGLSSRASLKASFWSGRLPALSFRQLVPASSTLVRLAGCGELLDALRRVMVPGDAVSRRVLELLDSSPSFM